MHPAHYSQGEPFHCNNIATNRPRRIRPQESKTGLGGHSVRAVYGAFGTRRSPVYTPLGSRLSCQHQLHLREVHFHKVVSAHPNVFSLHRVEGKDLTYIVMDYRDGQRPLHSGPPPAPVPWPG